MREEKLGEGVTRIEKHLAAGMIHADTACNLTPAEERRGLGAGELPHSPTQALARAISPSPAAMDQRVIESSRAIPPAGIVELVSFVSVLQMLHRLSSFYPTTDFEHTESA